MRALVLLLVFVTAFSQSAPQQQTFQSAEEAVQALVRALRSVDTAALLDVLGSGAESAIDSGDPVQDRNARERFLHAFEAEHALIDSAEDEMTLQVGAEQWPFPFPLVRTDGRWRFDTVAGVDEITNRRVGANELATIQSCLAFVDAQREYYSRNPQQSPVLQYAQKLISTNGQKDGLYWPTTGDEAPSPLGERFARARSEGYFKEGPSEGEPYHGYVYRLLTAQGPHSAGGPYSYLVGEKMIAGFALIAFPADYGDSGVKTFIVNHDGVVFSKDLGSETAATVQNIKSFDPDPSWTREAAIRPEQ